MPAFAFAVWWRNVGGRSRSGPGAEGRIGRGIYRSYALIGLLMESSDDDAMTYISRRLTRFACSLITCREYISGVAGVNRSRFFKSYPDVSASGFKKEIKLRATDTRKY